MHGSGLTVSESTRAEFARLSSDASTSYVKFDIADENFNIRGNGRFTDSRDNDFAAMQATLDNNPAFLVARSRGGTEDKWILVFYMPDKATVKDRMIYAASTAALRQGLGQGLFTPAVYAITSKSELTLSAYNSSVASGNGGSSVMTNAEKIKADNEIAAHMAMSEVKVSAIVGLPVQTTQESVDAVKQFAARYGSADSASSSSSSSGPNTLVFAMQADEEILMLEKSGRYSLDDVHTLVPSSEPRFVLHSFAHTHPESGEARHAELFIYYCPDKIKPKLKMFYSTCKSHVMKMMETFGVTIAKSIEVSDPKEVSDKQGLEELYPKYEEKKTFKKPTAGGQKGGRKFMGGGFQSSPSPSP